VISPTISKSILAFCHFGGGHVGGKDGVQPQPEGIYHLQDRVEVGTTFTGERFVKTFAGQAGVTSHLPHVGADSKYVILYLFGLLL